MRRTRLARPAPFAVLLVLFSLVAAAPASAKRITIPAARQSGQVAVFKLHGLSAANIKRARFYAPRYSRRIKRSTLRRASKRRVLRVRVPRRLRRGKARRRSTRLVVITAARKPRKGSSGPAPAPAPPTSTVPLPAPGTPSTLTAPGIPSMSDADAAARVRPTGEVRPANSTANHRQPTSTELSAWRAVSNYRGVDEGAAYMGRVTGAFSGTTDEVLQWASWKWGFDEDMVRAEAAWESTWTQSAVGDGGISYGILQLKSTIQKGTFPLSRDSTPFNADFALMTIRHCYDGRATWLSNGYQGGDIWGCIGYFYSGLWYDAGAVSYINKVKNYLSTRYWAQAGF